MQFTSAVALCCMQFQSDQAMVATRIHQRVSVCTDKGELTIEGILEREELFERGKIVKGGVGFQ